ncbi:hypothetical protein RQP46_005767 [Phenoliferia psychrophenolica]
MPAPKAMTPVQRATSLLAEALALVAEHHPAFPALREAHLTIAGLDPYLELKSSPLIVPSTHSVPEAEVRRVWDELLSASEATDWSALYHAKKTKWELHSMMCSGAYEATVLQHIALDVKAKTILEIGLFTGTTTLALALLPEVKQILALDIEPFLEDFDRPYWKRAGVSDKIVTRFGPAVESLTALKAAGHAPFDLVFVDADKPSYETYVRLLLDLELLAPEGLILADNTLYKGYVYAPEFSGETAQSPTVNLNSNNRSHSEATQGIMAYTAHIGVTGTNGYFPLRRRPVLSNELIDYIIGFVGDTNYDAQENIYICDCASLLACCLISKSFLPTARRLLYQSLTLESAGPSSIYPLNLIKTLEDSPALGQNVENLLLRCGAGPNEALTDATSRLLSKCRHLKHLYIETCKDEITDKYVELPSLITAISFSCPPLRSLHLAGISFARADSFEHDLLDGSGDTSTALHFATASSKYSLASMTLRSGPGVDLLALGYFSNLTHLDWRVQLPEDDPLFLQTHLQVLRDLSNLEHLQLSTENAPGAFTPLASTVTHLDFLPLSLKHIEVPFLSPSVLLLFVFKQASPNLKVLALVQPANADQNLWTRETIEGLDWACRSRGVRFYREHVVVMG